MSTSSRRKKGAADFAIFILIAIALVLLIMVAAWFGKITGQIKQLVKVSGMVDFYVSVDDKGTEFSFLESKKSGYSFAEILGALGSGIGVEGDFRTQLTSLEQGLDRIKTSDKKNYYLAVIDSGGKTVYEKKSGDPPITAGTGAEDLSLRWPLDAKNNNIISGFGWRKDPFTNLNSFHGGIDIGGRPSENILGNSVYSATDGEVVSTGFSQDFGNLVVIKYVSQTTKVSYYIYYGHLSSYSVKQGSAVKAGDEIGKIGSTGKSQGPHLHLEVRRDANSDNVYTPDKESVNLCPYLSNPGGTGIVDPKQCMKQCTIYENPTTCGIEVTIVSSRFDIPLVGGKKGGVELVIW